jgi:alpha-tubulin suppressor-like RCC1 family protein
MVSGLTGAVAVAPGLDSTYALLQGGTVVSWGHDTAGALGNGTSTDSLTPTKVVGVTNASAIATGQYFACAIADGTVKCWGYNSGSQLGNGTTTNSPVAVPVRW